MERTRVEERLMVTPPKTDAGGGARSRESSLAGGCRGRRLFEDHPLLTAGVRPVLWWAPESRFRRPQNQSFGRRPKVSGASYGGERTRCFPLANSAIGEFFPEEPPISCCAEEI